MKKILLIGGLGFIGHHLAQNLLQQGHKVFVIDNLSNSTVQLQEITCYSTEFYNLDIRDDTRFREVFPRVVSLKPDLTFLLAADHYIPFCEENPTRTIWTNVSSALACAKELYANIPGHRLIFFSSAAVFDGKGEPGCVFSETDLPKPSSIYGISKLTAEHALEWVASKYQGTLKILRCANVYGPGDQTEHLIPRIIKQLTSTGTLVVGNTSPIRDFIHVSDIVRAALQIAESSNQKTELFHLGTSKGTSVSELIDMLLKLGGQLGLDGQLQIQAHLKRPNDVKSLVLDNTTARRTLGWAPQLDLKNGLIQVLNWSLTKK